MAASSCLSLWRRTMDQRCSVEWRHRGRTGELVWERLLQQAASLRGDRYDVDVHGTQNIGVCAGATRKRGHNRCIGSDGTHGHAQRKRRKTQSVRETSLVHTFHAGQAGARHSLPALHGENAWETNPSSMNLLLQQSSSSESQPTDQHARCTTQMRICLQRLTIARAVQRAGEAANE